MTVAVPAAPPARADTSSIIWDVQFCDSYTPGSVLNSCNTTLGSSTSTDNGAHPTYVSRLQVRLDGQPLEPFYDVSLAQWSPNLVVNGGAPAGALAGEIKFSVKSNIDPDFFGTNNVKPSTGAPPACDAPGTAALDVSPTNLLSGTTTPTTNPVMTPAGFDFTKYVQAFDDDDNDLTEYGAGVDPDDGGDALPQTQADTNANGVPDGADRMPDFLPPLLNAAGVASLLRSRSFAELVIVPNVIQWDLHAWVLDFTSAGGGYVSYSRIDPVDPPLRYHPATAPQTLVFCPSVLLWQATYGVAADNPATPANESGTPLRTLDETKACSPQPCTNASVQYMVNVSSIEDYDEDGVPAGLDRCASDAAAGATDPDGDMVSGACDLRPASVDNDGDGVNEFSAGGTYPWGQDQDVDADGAANFYDNCPLLANADQRDQDADGAGDVCDAKPALGNARSGVPKPAFALPDGWISGGHDHDYVCNDAVEIDGPGENLDVPYGNPCETDADSSDDGVKDYNPTFADGAGGSGQRDSNSDADHDGVSDGEESDADGGCDGDPRIADSTAAGTLDGARDGPVPGEPCWRHDAATNGNASANPDGGGSPDSDFDGCSNKEEAGTNPFVGGGRDALWPYDFTDVPAPAGPQTGADGKLIIGAGSARNRAVTLADVSVVLAYVGRASSNPAYQQDNNTDGMPDGRQFDRTPAGGGHLSNAPSGAITLSDVGVALAQVGHACFQPP